MALYKTNYLNLVNITGTSYIVDNCINKKIKKLCFISSIAAIGEGTNEEITEDTEWNPEIEKKKFSKLFSRNCFWKLFRKQKLYFQKKSIFME